MLNTISSKDIRQTWDNFRRSVDQMFDSFYGQPAEHRAGRVYRIQLAVQSGVGNRLEQ